MSKNAAAEVEYLGQDIKQANGQIAREESTTGPDGLHWALWEPGTTAKEGKHHPKRHKRHFVKKEDAEVYEGLPDFKVTYGDKAASGDAPKRQTRKQKAVAEAEALGLDASGTAEEIEARIAEHNDPDGNDPDGAPDGAAPAE